MSDLDAPVTPRRRDAARTRRLLLDAARLRFIRDGYAATTVRDIADDAGVNVSLISRYFASKEGLFEACLGAAVTDLGNDTDGLSRDEIIARVAGRVAGGDRLDNSYVMLMRSSGDERIDEMRRAVLVAHARKLAATGAADEHALLRAEVVIAAAFGIAMIRSSLRPEPLASADDAVLRTLLTDLIDAVLPR
ncbi:AcrR family transcriptional regulator [Catenuloplanes nepalensis]|uniref:AcrR family transcriptional regulator n=1 Tax=Catenuloplanes nepalensis TaxID=587533 RepID=A0ABT9MTA1_9ACTN|nr:TetR family transcriptional regulator [Catenuloplanes nepalensis]MDP9794667.1 AcrR family transcriptional regulator [Catenuloplanes nepalensis]